MDSKALIIGAAGFVGGYLIDYLHNECKWSVCATKMHNEEINTNNANIENLDILNYDSIVRLLSTIKPEYIFHLAAQSSVAYSWKNPKLTVDVNINGTINLLNAVKEVSPQSRVLLIGSSEEYGSVQTKDGLINEEHKLSPSNIYAMTKVSQEMIGKIYADAYSMNIIMVRAFNHIGPKQSPSFVVSDFCKQVAEIEKGMREAVIKVGNLSARRDFTDVRDIVRAYAEIIQFGERGQVYNVGSSKAIEIRKILDMIISQVQCDIKVEIDPIKLRPVDTPVIEADISKLQKQIDWKPKYSIKDTIADTLNYWRLNI